ncbi:2-C-methyl-D-erythritol 2,4-cyclodiphosphate synthase [candidate division KSB1 bacterium]|nr:2-C-methyl-D-erythritol 2,4-cyclodiphosphate synthase [candidate division KSB1 bacterium]RQW07508.1 MAG: 2-C-methyl-D-erythritol 2,4-cyclodiphosphate synthase [candidate division KSB1 bacterium]
MRVGFGYDVHRLVADRALILGGVKIDHSHGLLGHSDADVLCHAICDALLGAAALGDIGQHFPDSDPRYKDAVSLHLLQHVVDLLRADGFQIANIDSMLILQRPKIAPFISTMRQHIARVCGIEINQVSVKATTSERLGFAGREEGVAAHAVVLIEKGKRDAATDI